MKRTSGFLRLGLALLFCLSTFVTVSPTSRAVPRNRCKDRCNDRYHRQMDECESLRKKERRRCEDRAKRGHDDCRRRCR
jgi:hypothetical protein